jgi:hypothetical protein
MSVCSYHWWFTYQFALVLLWEWTYNNPLHTSGYYRNYCFGEWNMCSKGGFPPFLSPHPMTNGYLYHKRQFTNFDGHCHYWPNSPIYGSTNINDNNTCNDDGCLGKDMIIHRMNTRWWFHSPCYWEIWVSSFPFRFIYEHLCTYHYCKSLAIFFSPLNVYFLLSTTCVHSHASCTSHIDSSTGCCTWLKFFISSTHHN